jgi:hypothetical protein
MKRVCGVLVLIAGVFGYSTAAYAQAKVNSVSDAICPAAIQQIKALTALQSSNDPDPAKIGDSARAIVRTYNDCIFTARTAGAIEPYSHYDQMRSAQYGILLGRALFLQKDYDGAHAAWVDARKLAAEVADWEAPAIGYTMNSESGSAIVKNPGHSKSTFHDLAMDIERAADAELAKLVPASPAP